MDRTQKKDYDRPAIVFSTMMDALRPLAVLLRASEPDNSYGFPFAGDVEVERMRLVGQIHKLALTGRAAVRPLCGTASSKLLGVDVSDEIDRDVHEADDILLITSFATEPRDHHSHHDVVEALFAVVDRVCNTYRDLAARETEYEAWDGEYLEKKHPNALPVSGAPA